MSSRPRRLLMLLALVLSHVAMPRGAANEPPRVSIHVGGNASFFQAGTALDYIVVVSDAEDGDTLAGTIDAHAVAVTFQYLESGFAGFQPAPVDPRSVLGATRGRSLIQGGDCVVCHFEVSSIQQAIPTYTDIAVRFEGNMAAAGALAVKIINGSQLAWGNIPMPAHEDLEMEAAMAMAYYILSFADPERQQFLPPSGSVTPETDAIVEQGRFGGRIAGRYVLTASYRDAGTEASAPAFGYAVHALRHPHVLATDYDAAEALETADVGGGDRVLVPGAESGHLMFHGLDLTGIGYVTVATLGSRDRWPGGRVELRLDAPAGRRIGVAEIVHGSAGMTVQRARIPVTPSSGNHDVYVVSRGRGGVGLGSLCFDCSE